MRVRTITVTAGVVSAGLALFVATGFGDDEAELRGFDTEYSTERADVHRVGQPSGQLSAAATGRASKTKKAKLLFFETPPPGISVGANTTESRDLPCPKGKVVTGYFLPIDESTMLAASAPSSRTSWIVAAHNFKPAAATQVIMGVVCETGVK